MNELEIKQENAVAISVDMKELIRAGVSENTLIAYRRALGDLNEWVTRGAEYRLVQVLPLVEPLEEWRVLNDVALAKHITALH